jgi:uncharacterized protein YgbK (DUF1537 family)
LLAWAEERSAGLFAAASGREIHLDELRRGGASTVADALRELASNGGPAVLAPDAETADDLALIAAGYATAIRAGVPAVVRCAPAFAGVLAGTTSPRLVDPPRSGEGGVLLVCGSYVPATTRQLGALVATRPGTLVEVSVDALAGPDARVEIARAAAAATAVLDRERFVAIATPRTRSEQLSSLATGERVAAGLAQVAGLIEPRPPVVIAKGGITSAVTLQMGLGVDVADVVGPVLPGVSLWHADAAGRSLDYLVVPGNVGDDDLLIRLLDAVVGG